MFVARGGALMLALMAATASTVQQAQHQHQPGEKLGTVHFETSCSADAQNQFDRALAFLHSFEFGPAIQGFTVAGKSDPGCGIAYWGVAVARWINPFAATIREPAQLQLGLDALKQAQIAGARTDRERAYLAAVSKLYAESGTLDQRSRVVAYEKAMAALAATYPADDEAAIFWALSLAASALPTDKTYANQLKAGQILEKLHPRLPNHPGISHYIIHSYDVPALAGHALDAARRYATIAPSAPHALHMPSHTFTRVGAWQDSIDTNIASAEAAKRIGGVAEELHAMDYMAYAYLQTGQDQAARAILNRLPEVASRFDVNAVVGAAPGSAGVFALAAMPARWALEHRDWKAAIALQPQSTQFPYTEAMTHFARALGAARTGALPDTRASIAALEKIRDGLVAVRETYWAEQVGIQREAAAAYLALAEGKRDEALATMRAAVTREDATDKNAVTPGPLAPARELLAEMLLELKQPAAALEEFRATLTKEPNRFRAVYGAARAASLGGDLSTARTYYQQLVKLCEKADVPGRPELVEAKKAARSAPSAPKRRT